MIFLKLFLTFFQIGAVSFGGGYAMISLIREKCLSNGWLTEEAIMNFIGVSESTPGPIAINMATFVGSSQGGILGSFFATLGVVLPSFIIILLIAKAFQNLIEKDFVQGILSGIKPVVVGLILGTAATLFLSSLCGMKTWQNQWTPDWFGFLIFLVVAGLSVLYKKWKKTPPSPILLILISAVLGICFYL